MLHTVPTLSDNTTPTFVPGTSSHPRSLHCTRANGRLCSDTAELDGHRTTIVAVGHMGASVCLHRPGDRGFSACRIFQEDQGY